MKIVKIERYEIQDKNNEDVPSATMIRSTRKNIYSSCLKIYIIDQKGIHP